MIDVDALTRRAVETLLTLSGRAMAFAARVALIAALICVPSFLLGLVVFTDGMRTVWIVLGGVFLVIAVGGPLLALWRLGRLRRRPDQLTVELRSRLSRDEQARRVVIENIEHQPETAAAGDSGASVVVWSRSFNSFGAGLGPSPEHPHLDQAVKTVATFPFVIIATALITAVFALLGVIFLIAAAL